VPSGAVATTLGAIQTVPEYVELFEETFPEHAQPVVESSLAKALSEFQRTLVSDHAPYDAYLDGDTAALSARMREGLELLSELQCDGCHEPPLFQSDRYARRLALDEQADRSGDAPRDLGRYEVTGHEADRGAFRVPTLMRIKTSKGSLLRFLTGASGIRRRGCLRQ